MRMVEARVRLAAILEDIGVSSPRLARELAAVAEALEKIDITAETKREVGSTCDERAT